MKNMISILILVFGSVLLCNAQQIEIEKAFGGYKYIQNGNRLTMNDLVNTMESNPDAYTLIKKAKAKSPLATVIGFIGGGLIGWPIGSAIGGGEPNWTLAGIGAAVIVVGIPIQSSINKKTKQAIDIYNSTIQSTSNIESKLDVKLLVAGNGVNLIWKF